MSDSPIIPITNGTMMYIFTEFPALYEDEVNIAMISDNPATFYLHIWIKKPDGSDEYLNYSGAIDPREIDIAAHLERSEATTLEQLVRCLIILIVQFHIQGHEDRKLMAMNDLVPVFMHVSASTRVLAVKMEMTPEGDFQPTIITGIRHRLN